MQAVNEARRKGGKMSKNKNSDESVEKALKLVTSWLDMSDNYDAVNYPEIEQGLLNNRFNGSDSCKS
jgi:hypothetical protein